jgi:hypothetical protein
MQFGNLNYRAIYHATFKENGLTYYSLGLVGLNMNTCRIKKFDGYHSIGGY